MRYYQKLQHAMKYVHKANITGRGTFPIDMLRYDSCIPASENDAAIINETMTGHKRLDGIPTRQPWRVQVWKHAVEASPITVWTPRRWESFGCKLEEIEQ